MSKKTRQLIVFDKKLSSFILKALGKAIDRDGYLIEKDTGQKVLSPDGEEIPIQDFAGVTKGSEIYLKSDIPSLINFVEKKDELA